MLKRHKQFRQKHLPKWEKLMKELFPYGIPEVCTWTSLSEIVEVLNFVGERSVNERELNHMFFPSSGGLDLTGATFSVENQCIELHSDGLFYIAKPKSLSFYSVNHNPDWMYFRLDTYDLKPSGVYEEISEEAIREDVTEVAPGVYEHIGIWEYGYYQYPDVDEDVRLREDARVVTRFLKGSFVIFCKASLYNIIRGKYDAYKARHNQMSADQFYRHIKDMANELKDIDI